ncbi:xylulokinase [Yinghuangia seranimata]|uniref:xylulokinase n=1 Tax=Yinghuangia seranimata TaxID=408067 RepID=UPI00248B79B4|nr:xylulokinase [Yinghuangia seranimata]MDI2131268.1 xylulokinase [Yinghuangia seranimata]
MAARLVAGVDSSTQSCKVVVCDAETGAVVRHGRAAHPDGTEVHPEHWWQALQEAVDDAGGLADVAALGVAAQQHGLVCLDEDGRVVRDALLWNDTRSARAAADLVAEFGGPAAWADEVGSVPVASFTVGKLRWLAEHEPDAAARVAAVCLPHDYLTWRLRGSGDIADLVTDRGDASGTGYWSPADGCYRDDLLRLAFGRVPTVPHVAEPNATAGTCFDGVVLSAGTGDNMAAALGLALTREDVAVSLGTSGTAYAVAAAPTADPTGAIAGFADATGEYLPLVCTLNAARVLDAAARMLGVDHARLAELALSAPPGADGLAFVPYLDGERTPNLPDATGSVLGLTSDNATPAHFARAAVEGMLCGLADALDALDAAGVHGDRVVLTGGAARSPAVTGIAPALFDRPVFLPVPAEYAATGAARQAAWAVSGQHRLPDWRTEGTLFTPSRSDNAVRTRYAEARGRHLERPGRLEAGPVARR